MKAAIYGQYYKEETISYIQELLKTLDERNIEVVIEDKFHKVISRKLSVKKYATFSRHQDLDPSFDGINVGRLGFLATIQKDEIATAIDLLLNKEYQITERSLLSVSTSEKNQVLAEMNIALNEISVTRKNSTSMITVETFLDDEYLTSYWADGLIIATPTGSTGYSLSCGGPVITPETQSFVVTPIAPHNLNARPLVIPDKTKIKLKVGTREKSVLVSLDSRITAIDQSTWLFIEKAPYTLKTIQLNNQTFLKTLREKLLWGEDRRN